MVLNVFESLFFRRFEIGADPCQDLYRFQRWGSGIGQRVPVGGQAEVGGRVGRLGGSGDDGVGTMGTGDTIYLLHVTQ